MATFLITGYKSGLGHYLHECFGGAGLGRDASPGEYDEIRRNSADIIIHCAGQPPRDVTSSALYPHLDDSVFLTKRLVEFRHKKFVFISSVDVYPKTTGPHDEDEDIPMESLSTFYAALKLMSESIVMKTCPNHLILRCAALLGAYARQNSLIKIAEEDNPALSLCADSLMNYVRHSQIADFIKYASENDLKGVYNVASSENVTLGRVAELLKRKARFGSHKYAVGDISNRKISSAFPSFKKTSEDIVLQFVKEDLPKRNVRGKARIL